MKILYISSLSPLNGPGSIAMDHYKALKSAGHKVDFLTHFRVDGHPEIKYVEKKESLWYRIKLQKNIFFRRFLDQKALKGRDLFYRKETDVHYGSRRIFKIIDDDYDVVMIYFVQRLLTFKTIRDIVEHCARPPKVVLLNPDYFTMTAGCHFMRNCVNYEIGCRYCPILKKKDCRNFITWNAQYRKKFYEDFKPVVGANRYMLEFFTESAMLKGGAKLFNNPMILDLERFKPHDKAEIRKKHGVGDEYEFVILYGCQELKNKRKGMDHMVDALQKFYEMLDENLRKRILVVSIGKKSEDLFSRIPFPQLNLGYVDLDNLAEIYSLADLFVSPSVDDAGPSMVNQSIACGTPVVAFEMGTALEVIKGRNTGLCVPLRDSGSFADAIFKIYSMPTHQYTVMSRNCRDVAVEMHSYDAFIQNVESQLAEA